jgi:hypothetical protein
MHAGHKVHVLRVQTFAETVEWKFGSLKIFFVTIKVILNDL